jgi:uncharacterized membrane protein YeaQ/YmgE (transglycosylase-associated protein family)
MLSLLSWLITGLVVGLIARAIVPGRQSLGIIMTIVLGVIGAVLGGLISMAIWPTWANDPNVNRMWPGWLLSIVGAVVVLWGYVAMTSDRSVSTRT